MKLSIIQHTTFLIALVLNMNSQILSQEINEKNPTYNGINYNENYYTQDSISYVNVDDKNNGENFSEKIIKGGYVHTFSSDLYIASPSDDYKLNVGFYSIHQYIFYNKILVGAGYGVKILNSESYIPLYLNIQYYIFKNRLVLPFIGINTGYSFPGGFKKDNYEDKEIFGGYFIELFEGINITTNKNFSFQLKIGFQIQKAKSRFNEFIYWNELQEVEELKTYKRLMISVAVCIF